MSDKALMHLKILLPFGVFTSESGIINIVAETNVGSIGILPRRMDCVAALSPGILVYQTDGGREVYIAVDGGILIKFGFEVLVSVRNAVRGSDLIELQETVEKEFLVTDPDEENLRYVLSKMETAFLKDLAVQSHG